MISVSLSYICLEVRDKEMSFYIIFVVGLLFVLCGWVIAHLSVIMV